MALCNKAVSHLSKASGRKGKLFLNIVSDYYRMDSRKDIPMNDLLYGAVKSAFRGFLDHQDRKWPVDLRSRKTEIFMCLVVLFC